MDLLVGARVGIQLAYTDNCSWRIPTTGLAYTASYLLVRRRSFARTCASVGFRRRRRSVVTAVLLLRTPFLESVSRVVRGSSRSSLTRSKSPPGSPAFSVRACWATTFHDLRSRSLGPLISKLRGFSWI